MANAPIQFDSVDIGTIGFLFEGDETAVASDCNGSLSVETETQEIQKKCGATVVASVSKPTEMTITLEAHLPVEVFRRVQGIKPMEELKAGVYAYGGSSAGEKFALTAEIVDLFTGESKLIAFPKAAINTGLTFEIEAGNDEVAYVEIETKAYQDELGNWYYEAFPSEADQVNKVEWLTKFSLETVKKSGSVAVTGVSVNPTSTTLNVGQGADITVTVSPENATDKSFTVEGANDAIATHEITDGKVSFTGVAAGEFTATIKTTDGAKTATVKVTVNEA